MIVTWLHDGGMRVEGLSGMHLLSGLARNFGDVFVGPLCGGREGGVFVGGDALE